MNLTRKQQILSVALDLFYRRSISGVTMDDIAQSLSISKKTLYKDFKSKELLLMKIAIMESNRFHAAGNSFVSEGNSDFATKCALMIESLASLSTKIMPVFFRDIKENYPPIYQVILDYKENSVHSRFRSFITNNIKRGDIRNTESVDTVVSMYEIIFDWFLKDNIDHTSDGDERDMHYNPYPVKMAEQLRILLRGICTDVERFDERVYRITSDEIYG